LLNTQERKEVVLAAAPFTINTEPLDVINFTYPFDIQPYTFMYRRPRELSRTLLFVNPFTPLVIFRNILIIFHDLV
jgi:hypothetical protein